MTTTHRPDADDLCLRGVELLREGRIGEAAAAFTRVLVLSGLPVARIAGERLVDYLLSEARQALAERQHRSIVDALYRAGDADYLQHVGLPADASLEAFRERYTYEGGKLDGERALNDWTGYLARVNQVAQRGAEEPAGD